MEFVGFHQIFEHGVEGGDVARVEVRAILTTTLGADGWDALADYAEVQEEFSASCELFLSVSPQSTSRLRGPA